MSQHERRITPASWSWEIAAAVLLAGLFLLALGVQLARSLAVWVSGQGWVWPAPRGVLGSVPSILAGDAAAGLDRPLDRVDGLALWLVMVELGVLVLVGWAVSWLVRRYGPRRLRGVATAADAEALLGRRRLWRVRRIIRPDLYGSGRRALRQPPDPSGSESRRR